MPNHSLQRLKVILIGSGNVAMHLGQALLEADVEIVQVYSQHIAHAKTLAKKLKAKAISSISKIKADGALIILAIKDDAIAGVVKKLKVSDGIVVHTSGSISIDVLKKFHQHGIIYPLQTFSKNRKVDFRNIPVCIEGSDVSTLLSLSNIAETISDCVYHLDSKQREEVHLAAVFANNFTNHLYALSEEILQKNKLPFDLLRPLILETAEKVQSLSPLEAQTGPALRKDQSVMKKHLALLKKHPQLKKIYSEISAGISKKSTPKKSKPKK
jgi:predicted short-subunit dehydrogenase-like oxidoreductase (DUF2520 family)